MINDTDVKLIIDVFKKCELTENEEKYLNKLELFKKKLIFVKMLWIN